MLHIRYSSTRTKNYQKYIQHSYRLHLEISRLKMTIFMKNQPQQILIIVVMKQQLMKVQVTIVTVIVTVIVVMAQAVKINLVMTILQMMIKMSHHHYLPWIVIAMECAKNVKIGLMYYQFDWCQIVIDKPCTQNVMTVIMFLVQFNNVLRCFHGHVSYYILHTFLQQTPLTLASPNSLK